MGWAIPAIYCPNKDTYVSGWTPWSCLHGDLMFATGEGAPRKTHSLNLHDNYAEPLVASPTKCFCFRDPLFAASGQAEPVILLAFNPQSSRDMQTLSQKNACTSVMKLKHSLTNYKLFQLHFGPVRKCQVSCEQCDHQV